MWFRPPNKKYKIMFSFSRLKCLKIKQQHLPAQIRTDPYYAPSFIEHSKTQGKG
jgi:hypothetical protein